MKDKEAKTYVHVFIEIVNKSNRIPIKLMADLGEEFYNSAMRNWLGDNYILMYFTHNESISVVTESLIRTLKSKILQLIKKPYLGCLNKLADRYNNTDHRSI